MDQISAKIKIDASPDQVWKIVSETDNDKEYWTGMRHIRNLSKEQNVITREVFLDGDNRCRQRIILFPKEGVHIKWLKGPITGIKDIMISKVGRDTMLEVHMSYKLSGIIGLFSTNASEHFQREAEVALQLIKEKSEGIRTGPPLEERKLWADLIRSGK